MANDNRLAAIREQLLHAAGKGQKLRIRGNGSKHWYGNAGHFEFLDVAAYAGIINYDPAELVITAACGTPLNEIDQALAERHQQLGFEPPDFDQQASIGGAVAAGLSGPGRMSGGALKDSLLGAVVMNGEGQILKFGGQVMKNVAGYDVARLMSGSMGTLGIILQVSLKVMPRPVSSSTLVLRCDERQALAMFDELRPKTLPITASVWHAGKCYLRLSGAAAAVKLAQDHIAGELMPAEEAEAFWKRLRDQTHEFFQHSNEQTLWRLSLPAETPPMHLSESTLLEWQGQQRWLFSAEPAEKIRTAAASAGGHATAFRNPPEGHEVFSAPGPVQLNIQRRLKRSFDPNAVFDGSRLYRQL